MSPHLDTAHADATDIAIYSRLAHAEPRGAGFYTPVHDAVARLLSGIACALLTYYAALLAAWWAGGAA